jgi:hypothetical protein
MEALDKLKNLIKNLEDKDFYPYLLGFLLALALLMGSLIYWHYKSSSYWHRQLNELKTQRQETKKLLSEHQAFEQNRLAVNEILSTNTGFKIVDYYNNLVNDLKLQQYKAKEQPAEPTTEQLEEGAKEITLTLKFNNITMQQVTEILAAIENNPRVYAKKVIIDKVNKDQPKLNVTIDIATIELASQPT